MPREDGTRYIEDMRGIHAGEEIWIIGSGPSMDDIPLDFFNGKISIALNDAYISHHECTYVHSCDIEFMKGIYTNYPELLGRCIFTERPNLHWAGHPELIQMNFAGRQGKRADIRRIVKNIGEGKRCCHLTVQTIAHTAIQAAAIFGASKITLVGCEARTFDGQSHAAISGRGDGDISGVLPGWRNGTKWLAEDLARIGIEVRRYYHKDRPSYGVRAGYAKIDYQGDQGDQGDQGTDKGQVIMMQIKNSNPGSKAIRLARFGGYRVEFSKNGFANVPDNVGHYLVRRIPSITGATKKKPGVKPAAKKARPVAED